MNPTKAPTADAQHPKDPYAKITEQILALLNRGVVPWRKPWSGGWPRNLFSNRSYGLFNAMFLNVAGFGSPFWATQHQIEKRQGSIREDQVKKPASVFVTLPPRRYLVNAGEFGRIPRIGGLLRFHEIWNVEQTTGLERFIPKPKQTVPVDEAKKVVQEMPKPVFLRRNPGQAYYVPSRDFISIPSESQFTSLEAYYATLFHELVHATGHPCRLKRKALDEWTSLGDHAYSQEELVAEFGAAMLCGLTGLAPLTIQNSAAYVQSWLKVLGNDKTLLVMAAGQAQKACDFIRAIEKPTSHSPEGGPINHSSSCHRHPGRLNTAGRPAMRSKPGSFPRGLPSEETDKIRLALSKKGGR